MDLLGGYGTDSDSESDSKDAEQARDDGAAGRPRTSGGGMGGRGEGGLPTAAELLSCDLSGGARVEGDSARPRKKARVQDARGGVPQAVGRTARAPGQGTPTAVSSALLPPQVARRRANVNTEDRSHWSAGKLQEQRRQDERRRLGKTS